MAWPASTQTVTNAFDNANINALKIKGVVQSVRDASAAGPIPRTQVLLLLRRLKTVIDIWNTSGAVTGIQDYARDQLGNPTLDVSAEFTAMKNAAIALKNWIYNNFPKDSGSDAVLLYSVDADGVETALTFTTAQLDTFRTHATTFIATIS